MKQMMRFSVLFVLMLVCTLPVFAQESVGTTVSQEDVILMDEPDEGVITGRVTSLDVDAGLISVKADGKAEKTFSILSGETILWKGIEDIELTDINKGEEAEIGYYVDDGGKVVASWVDILIEEVGSTEPELEVEEKGSSTE